MSATLLESDIIYLPGDEGFYDVALYAALILQPEVFHSPEHAFVQDAMTGLLRSVDAKELEEYIEGGELKEVENNFNESNGDLFFE
jgi:hypothetical protein